MNQARHRFRKALAHKQLIILSFGFELLKDLSGSWNCNWLLFFYDIVLPISAGS